MKIVKSVVNAYEMHDSGHMLWNAKHRLCKQVYTSKDIEKKRKQKPMQLIFFMVDIRRYDEQNKLETKKNMLQI